MCRSKAEGGRRCMSHLSKDLGPGFHEAYTKLADAAKEFRKAPEPAPPRSMPFEQFDQRMRTDDAWANEILEATKTRARERGVDVTEDLAREVAYDRNERARRPIRLYERSDEQMREDWRTRQHNKAKRELAQSYDLASAELDRSNLPLPVQAEARNVINAMVAETHAGRETEVAHRNRDFDVQHAAAARRDEATEFRRRSTEGLQVALGYDATKVEAEPIPKPAALNPRYRGSNKPIAGPPMLAKESQGLPKLDDHFTGVTITNRSGETLWSGEFSGSIRDPKFTKFFEQADEKVIGTVYFNTRRPVPSAAGPGHRPDYEDIITSAHITTLKPKY